MTDTPAPIASRPRALSRRDQLRRATQAQHDLAEARWTGAGAWRREDYQAFLQTVLDAHRQFGQPAALRLGRDMALEQARLDALCGDLGLPPAPPVAAMSCASAAWGAAYVLNGSALGASIMLKTAMVPQDWPQAYLRLGRDYAAAGGLRGFFADLEAADLDLSRAIDGARRCFALFEPSHSAHTGLDNP